MDETAGQSFTEKFRKLLKRKDASDGEVLAVVEEFKNQGVIEDEEAEMISNVMEFSDTVTSDIMTHRTKIVAIEDTTDVETALRYMLEENHSRYPVFKESIDNIIGILYCRDIMLAYLDGNKSASVFDYIREAFYVPESMPIDNLFEELRNKRTHVAVVIDEYGQTAGVVTMEDIIEELVGDIFDEFDEKEDNFTETVAGKINIVPDISLEDLIENNNIPILEKDLETFDTLNGLLIMQLGHIPAPNERASIEYNNYRYDVYSLEGKVLSEIIAEKID